MELICLEMPLHRDSYLPLDMASNLNMIIWTHLIQVSAVCCLLANLGEVLCF